MAKGKFSQVFEARHNHAGDPEKDDIGAGDEVGCRVKLFQLGGFCGPTESGKGPEPGAEPGIEDIRILGPVLAGRFDLSEGFVSSIPDRDTVAPPELSADAPVLKILHPVVIDFAPAIGRKAELA